MSSNDVNEPALSNTLSLLSVRTPLNRRVGGFKELEGTAHGEEAGYRGLPGQEHTGGGTSPHVRNSVFGQLDTQASKEATFPVR